WRQVCQLSRVIIATARPAYLGQLFNKPTAEPRRILHDGIDRRDKLAFGLLVIADVLDDGQHAALAGNGYDFSVNQTLKQSALLGAQLKSLFAHAVSTLQQNLELS